MGYKETILWLYSRLPFYQKTGKKAYNKNLSSIKSFINNVKKNLLLFPSVHVGGTNGKGSVCHMLSSILQESGYKVGLFTSPHMFDFRERIKINGQKISKNFVVDFVNAYKSHFERLKMSFFEMNVVMAFEYFTSQKVDIAIIEVGLGGRLDATNVINPELSIITNTSFDHTNLLGTSLDSITKEKAGIIKKNTPILVGEKNSSSNIIENVAMSLGSKLYYSDSYNYNSDLKGDYQKYNINTVVSATTILKELGFNINQQKVILGLNNVIRNTNLMGRWQVLNQKPLTIFDIAHNNSSIEIVFNQLLKKKSKIHIIMGLSSDKDIKSIVEICPPSFLYYICGSLNDRILDPNIYASLFDSFNLKYKIFDLSYSAYNYCLSNSNQKDILCITGSTFIVSDMLKYLDKV